MSDVEAARNHAEVWMHKYEDISAENIKLYSQLSALRAVNARLREDLVLSEQQVRNKFGDAMSFKRRAEKAEAALASTSPEPLSKSEQRRVAIQQEAKGESGEADEYPVPYEIKSGACCVPCPHGIPGKALPVVMLGSASCRACEYSGDRYTTGGSIPVKCFYNARHRKSAEEQKS